MIPAELTIRVTNVYGNRAVYPVCETAKRLTQLLGTKTFTPDAIEHLKGIGFSFVIQPQTL